MAGTPRLWFTVLAGPLAWLAFLQLSYGLAAWPCAPRRAAILATAAGALLVALGGAWVARRASVALAVATTDRGAQRARFMAVLGLGLSLLFALVIVAGSIPAIVLRPCD